MPRKLVADLALAKEMLYEVIKKRSNRRAGQGDDRLGPYLFQSIGTACLSRCSRLPSKLPLPLSTSRSSDPAQTYPRDCGDASSLLQNECDLALRKLRSLHGKSLHSAKDGKLEFSRSKRSEIPGAGHDLCTRA